MKRGAAVTRNTKETQIVVEIDLEGDGRHAVSTPLAFLTHMLEQVAKHGVFDLRIEARGDVEIDGHHTTEDVGIALGQAVDRALADRAGICRYGFATLPMDEACVTAAIDLSGRPFCHWAVPLPKAKLGDFDVELAEVFFEGFSRGAQCNLHVHRLAGENLHHLVEVSFKAFARALGQAVALDPRRAGDVPSTKGSLGG